MNCGTGKDTRVNRRSVTTDERLRHLLRTGRRASGHMSQRDAAARASISEVYWQKIESGAQLSAPAETLAAMCTVAGITAARLRAQNCTAWAQIADALDDLSEADSPEQQADPEEHLAAMPGATQEEISALQAVWRALRAKRSPEPFEPEFRRTRRRGSDKEQQRPEKS